METKKVIKEFPLILNSLKYKIISIILIILPLEKAKDLIPPLRKLRIIACVIQASANQNM